MSGLMELPIAEVVDTGVLDGGVFPCREEGMTVVRDVPAVLLESQWEELDEALSDPGVTEAHYTMDFEPGGVVITVRLDDPYLHFQIILPRDPYDDFYHRARNTEMVVVSLVTEPQHMMLLTFDGAEDAAEAG